MRRRWGPHLSMRATPTCTHARTRAFPGPIEPIVTHSWPLPSYATRARTLWRALLRTLSHAHTRYCVEGKEGEGHADSNAHKTHTSTCTQAHARTHPTHSNARTHMYSWTGRQCRRVTCAPGTIMQGAHTHLDCVFYSSGNEYAVLPRRPLHNVDHTVVALQKLHLPARAREVRAC